MDALTGLMGLMDLAEPMAAQAVRLLGQLPGGPLLLLLAWMLWVFYLAVMNLKRARDMGRLGRAATVAGMPALVVGMVLDVVVGNWLLATLVLWEPPRWGEWTLTARLRRHKRESTGRRLAVARWMGSELLDPFDPSGAHL